MQAYMFNSNTIRFTIGHSKEFSKLRWSDAQKSKTIALKTNGKKGRTLAVIVDDSMEVFKTWVTGLSRLLGPDVDVVETNFAPKL